MPYATIEEQKELGLTPPPPGVPEHEPEIKVKLAKLDPNTYRQLMPLTPEQMTRVKTLMKKVCQEWKRNTRLQNNKLLRTIDRFEGISGVKNFPWPNCSNVNIPYSEMEILVAYDIVCATALEADPIYFVREMIPAREGHPEEHIDPKVELFLNWVFKNQMALDDAQRMAVLLAFRDPISLLCLDWVEEVGKEYRVEIFEDFDSLKKRFPDAQSAGVPQTTYDLWVQKIAIEHEPIALEIEEKVVKYRGPKPREVELKDFVRVPVSCPDLKYTVFHGDQFRQRKAWFVSQAKNKHFYKDEVDELVKATGKPSAIDEISQELDTIEGISSNRLDPDEYDCVRGNLKIDLNNDGEEEMYHVVYNTEQDRLLRMEKYPYWHNRSNYVPYRIRRKPNRLLGRCFMDMLYDLNEAVNTEMNQMFDSKTITTVPSFLVNASETDLIENMTRKDQNFFPGCRFVVTNMNNMKQLDTKVDLSGVTQDINTLMSLGEMLTGTGAMGSRSGAPGGKDPRASGKKVQQLIGQSNQRIDGYIRELRPSFKETAAQVLELYYQFSPDTIIEFSSYDDTTNSWARNDIKRVSLRNRNMSIELARTSVLDNPDAVLQRALTDYQLWKDEPLVGGNITRRWELIRATMFAEKKPNIPKLLPPLKQILQEMQQQDQMAGGSPSQQALLEGTHERMGKKKREPDGKRQGSPDMRPSQLDRSQKGGT